MEKIINNKGFYIKTRIHKDIGTRFDNFCYDIDGYNIYGYNREGFDRNGLNITKVERTRFDKLGYNIYDILKDIVVRFNNEGCDTSVKTGEEAKLKPEIETAKMKNEIIEKKDVFTSSEEEFEILIEKAEINFNLEMDMIPQKKRTAKMMNGIKQWPRDPAISKTRIYLSGYKCEYNAKHKTFISKTTNQQFMEVHHLIPINNQDRFENSLDVLGNVVSLCPTCHRMIHFGDTKSKNIIIEKLHMHKQEELQKYGLKIELEDLKNLYS